MKERVKVNNEEFDPIYICERKKKEKKVKEEKAKSNIVAPSMSNPEVSFFANGRWLAWTLFARLSPAKKRFQSRVHDIMRDGHLAQIFIHLEWYDFY